MSRLRDESGITLIELVITMFIFGLVATGLTNILISGTRASSDASGRVAGQGSIQTAVSRLEYELRCASGATVSADQTSVTLSLPSECPHTSTGDYTWCVSGTLLTRTPGDSCTATGQVFATDVTSAAPFTLVTATGDLPRLQLDLSVNSGGVNNDTVSISEVVTLRNAARS